MPCAINKNIPDRMAQNLLRPFIRSVFPIPHSLFELTCRKMNTPSVRLYPAIPKKPELAAPAYIKKDHEFKITKKSTVNAVQNLFGVRTFQAMEIVSKSKMLRKVSSATMKSNYTLYMQKGITKETLLNYPELLAVSSADQKLIEIEKLPYGINTTAVLFLVPLNLLKKLVQSEMETGKEDGKIATLSRLLQVTEQEACTFIAKKLFLCSLSPEKIQTNIKLLLDFGISLEEIRHDLWVLRYNDQTIENRLNDAKRHKIEILKTWMVRVQPEIFQTYIQRRSDNKTILGNSSLTEYLSERLECSTEVSNFLILKQPALKNKSLKKLKELIDFLYDAGFKPHHICRVPKILVHSVDTIRKRLKQLEDKNIQIDSLHMLTKSQKQFTQYYEALLKSKKLKNTT